MAVSSRRTIELDPDLIRDFSNEFQEAYEDLQRTLVEVDQCLDKAELNNQLFRIVHSIKSNLHMMGLTPLCKIVHALENILDEIRNNRLSYSPGISDMLLVAINRVREFARALFAQENIDEEISKLQDCVEDLWKAEPSVLPRAIARFLAQFDPDHALHEDANEPPLEAPSVSSTKVQPSASDSQCPLASAIDPALQSDMQYFEELVRLMASSLPHLHGRNQRVMALCLAMNAKSGNAVDVTQLTAAVYLHDLGMAFVPAHLLNKAEGLTADETQIIRSHCKTAYEWLKRIPGWEEAATMVYQHHERMDGRGYPQGLAGEAICPGARIIAIADTFDAMTSPRAWREHQRPLMRAVLEINSGAGQQFDGEWVANFNAVVKKIGYTQFGQA